MPFVVGDYSIAYLGDRGRSTQMRSGDLAQGHLHTKVRHWLLPNFPETVQKNSLSSLYLFPPFLFPKVLQSNVPFSCLCLFLSY